MAVFDGGGAGISKRDSTEEGPASGTCRRPLEAVATTQHRTREVSIPAHQVLPLEAPAPGGHEVSSRLDWKPGGTTSPHTKPRSRERGCAEGYDREMDQTLFDVVSILTDYRSVRAFDCRAEVRLGDRLTVYRLHAEPSIDSYEVSSSDGLVVGSYIASRGLVYDGGETLPYDPRGVVWRALPARLAFPLELPIWGRSGDSHRLDAASMQNDGSILVTLAPNRDREGRGRFVVDPSLKLVTEFDVPNLEIRYRDVEPGRGRLLVP